MKINNNYILFILFFDSLFGLIRMIELVFISVFFKLMNFIKYKNM